MICKKNSNYYDSREPVIPLKMTGAWLSDLKMLTVVKQGATTSARPQVLHPHTDNSLLAVVNFDESNYTCGLVNGTYRKMCNIDNTLYLTDPYTDASYTAPDFSAYQPYFSAIAGTPGASGTPMVYAFQLSTGYPAIRLIYSLCFNFLVVGRDTDIARINSIRWQYYMPAFGNIAGHTIGCSLASPDPYWGIKALPMTVGGRTVYSVYGCQGIYGFLPYTPAQIGTYATVTLGIHFSSITGGTEFYVLKGLIGIDYPGDRSYIP